MIDATRSPRPAWQRYATLALLAALIVVAAVVIWKKELHHSSSSAAAPTHVMPVPLTPRAASPAPTTTIPGGVAVSGRDPFAG